MVQVRAEGPKAPSPGHRPGYDGNQQGRQVCVRNYPGRCPGLGAFALSGRFNRTDQKVFSKKSAQRFGSFKRLHYLCIIEKRMTSIDR